MLVCEVKLVAAGSSLMSCATSTVRGDMDEKHRRTCVLENSFFPVREVALVAMRGEAQRALPVRARVPAVAFVAL